MSDAESEAPPAAPTPPLTSAELGRGDLLLARIIDFARLLWELGLDVGPGRVVDLARSLPLVDLRRRDDFYALLKVSLLSRHEQEQLFDNAFAFFWRGEASPDGRHDPGGEEQRKAQRSLALPQHRQPQDAPEIERSLTLRPDNQRHPASRLNQARQREREDDEEAMGNRAFSAEELLKRKDFEDYTWEELQEAKRLMAEARWRLGERVSRRTRPARRGRRPDLRRTFRASLRTGGEPILLARRERRVKPRPLVILCDISGSMSLYSRLLLHFVHTVSNGLEQVETFVFGTRLTRITRQLARRDVDEAVRDVSKSVQDWSGGTRIGDSLRTFNYRWARRVLGRGAVVLIISDGWDRGDTRMLSEEMARLRRSCHRLIWINPLLGLADYRPVTAGMRAALPYIDNFLPGNNLASLLALGKLLEQVEGHRRPTLGAAPRPGERARAAS
jgi:uncharacterized protein